MNMKKCTAFLMAAIMLAGLLMACSSSGSGQNTQVSQSSSEDTQNQDTPVASNELENVEFFFVHQTGTFDDVDAVCAAINEITEPEIGVHFSMQLIEIGSYNSKLGLELAGGSTFSLASLWFASAGCSALYANGMLHDLTGLLDDYGNGIQQVMGEYVNAYSIDGKIVALAPYRCYCSDAYIIMRKDILEELDMLDYALNMSSWAEVEALWDQVKEAYPELNPTASARITHISLSGDTFADAVVYDDLGDSLDLIYTDLDTNTVKSLVEEENFVDGLKRAQQWMEKGYVWPDLVYNNSEHADNLINQGVAFCELMESELGVESAKTSACGHEMVATSIKPFLVTSSSVQKFGLFIPTNAEAPEAAMKFLNLWYTDSRIANLMIYGLEGEHYVMLDTGEADYPEGVTATTVGYHVNDFMCGNQFLVKPWKGAGGDQRERASEAMASATASPYLGFTFDSDGLDNTIAGLTAVTEQYSWAMGNGGYTEAFYQEYVAALYNQGLDDYIAAHQKQLDAWLAMQ